MPFENTGTPEHLTISLTVTLALAVGKFR